MLKKYLFADAATTYEQLHIFLRCYFRHDALLQDVL